MQISDCNLLQQSRAGHRQAFGELVTRYQALVRAVAFSATGDHALSEDLAQEAFVTAWVRLGELRELERFPGWVCGIVRNLARYARRHERRHAPRASETLGDCVDVASGELSPLESTLAAERDALVWRALCRVPECYREPLVLFYREQQSVAEVADALGVSEEVVKQRLCRGRRYLRRDRDLEAMLAASRPAARRDRDLGVLVLAAISLGVGVQARAAAPLGNAGLLSITAMLGAGGTGALSAVLAASMWLLAARPATDTRPALADAPERPRIAAPAPARGTLDGNAAVSLPVAPEGFMGVSEVAEAQDALLAPRARAQVTPGRARTTVRSAARPGVVIERGPTAIVYEVASVRKLVAPPLGSAGAFTPRDAEPTGPLVIMPGPFEDIDRAERTPASHALPIDPPDLRARIFATEL